MELHAAVVSFVSLTLDSTLIRQALNGESTDNFIFPLFTKDGERVEVLLNATTRVDAEGNVVGVVGVGQDITKLSQAQAEMSQVAADLKMLIENANAPIFGIDADGNVNEWNRSAAQITGYTKEEVCALSHAHCILPAF